MIDKPLNELRVCNCNLVYANEIKEFVDVYPEIRIEHIASVFKIGQRCGSCLMEDSPSIDINFKILVDKIKNNEII